MFSIAFFQTAPSSLLPLLLVHSKNIPVLGAFLYVPLMWNVVLPCVAWFSPSLHPCLSFRCVIPHPIENNSVGYSSSSLHLIFLHLPYHQLKIHHILVFSVYCPSPLSECKLYNAETLPGIILGTEYSKQSRESIGILNKRDTAALQIEKVCMHILMSFSDPQSQVTSVQALRKPYSFLSNNLVYMYLWIY